MVKKYFKREFSDLLRLVRFAWIALLGVSILTSCAMLLINNVDFESIEDISFLLYEMFYGAMIPLFMLAVSSVFLFTFGLFVVRFYRSMLSNEGYLTHSIPLRTTQLLNVKLLAGVIIFLLDVLAALIAAVIVILPTALTSATLKELWEGFTFLWNEIFSEMALGYRIALIAEAVLICLAGLCFGLIYPVTCMSVGQRFKNRILMSVVFYVGISWILQFVTSAGYIVAVFFLGAMEEFNPQPGPTLTLMGAVLLVLLSGAAVGGYFLSRHMLTKKLNLA